MCGICGKLNFSGQPISGQLIEAMLRPLDHRGPDDQGVYTAAHIGLGQKRLSIIDLNHTGTAPLANEDGSVWVVFNGEIYNFEVLRAELAGSGHVFRTGTDTEVIVHLYEQYGFECLSRMRGMFAFALWDARRKVLFAARDRLGKKPLCYARTGNGLSFGSEIKAITADPSVSVAPDFEAIDRYLTWHYVPSPRTAFHGIRRLPPGHYLTCTAAGEMRVTRYWSPPRSDGEDGTFSEEEVSAELVRTLRESVALRMRSDVPVGAFLSGGIDSGLIVALMAQSSGRPVKTFSIGFAEEEYNELPFARLVAERYGTEHHEFQVQPKAAEVLPKLVWHYNEPFADSSALPTYYVAKMTREHVTVALSGDGGDEVFGGYNRYGEQLRWMKAERIPGALRWGASQFSDLVDTLPHQRYTARLSRLSYQLGATLPERYLLNMMCVKPQEKRAAYTPQFRGLIAAGAGRAAEPEHFPYEPSMDPLDWMMGHDLTFYLPDCLMVKADIASMANSLEVRSPFLDHRLIEFAATVPSRWKRVNGTGKLIVRKALGSLLPDQILSRPKTGFGVPVAAWLRGELAPMLRETLEGDTFSRRGLFHGSFIRTMIEEHSSGKRDWSNRLWAFLFLELWFREFID